MRKKYTSLDPRMGREAKSLTDMVLIYRLSGWDETQDGHTMSDIDILQEIIHRGIQQ